MSYLRCRPFAFWLLFSLAGTTLLAVAALGGGADPVPPAAPVADRSPELAVMMPELLGAAQAADGSLAARAQEFAGAAERRAGVLDARGQGPAADAHRELARYAATLTAGDADRALWRTQALARAVSAVGVGSTHPLDQAAWDGPPPPAPTTTIPPAAERLSRMEAQLSAGHGADG